jgi:hypothetical protein
MNVNIGHAIDITIHVLAVALSSAPHAYLKLIIVNVKIRNNVVGYKILILS